MEDLALVRSLYSEGYAESYDDFYLKPWPNKHRFNVETIARVLSHSGCANGWLDLCCGQAWHFSQFPDSIFKVGIDISDAQLRRAIRRNPGARFVKGDVLQLPLRHHQVDFTTCFWGAYCYLDSHERISAFVDSAIAATRPRGTVYMEVLLPEMLESFNRSAFAQRYSFRVKDRGEHFTRWAYTDSGGEHRMTSPPLAFFLDRFRRSFDDVTVQHDEGFMYHLVASGKRESLG